MGTKPESGPSFVLSDYECWLIYRNMPSGHKELRDRFEVPARRHGALRELAEAESSLAALKARVVLLRRRIKAPNQTTGTKKKGG